MVAANNVKKQVVPAATLGWLPTTPTVRPFILANPTMIFLAYLGIISKKSLSSTMP